MSIKDLFNSKGSPKIQKSVTTEELVDQVESSDFVEAKRTQFGEFVPPIDFSTATNFAKFGSAELYYEKSFERIYQYYPYDGTLHEKIEFENSSSYLDKYVFDYLYPRTNGYLNFNSSSYISVFGGPHTASAGMTDKPLDSTFDLSMKYDEAKKRTSAFEFRGEDGITAEFWYKKNPSTSTQRTIFHISGAAGDIEVKSNNAETSLSLIVKSGSESINPTFAFITDTNWNHYAVTLLSSSAGLTTKGYKNGQEVKQVTSPKNIPSLLPTTDAMNMRIGRRFDDNYKLSGSLDEFRFWKTARTSEDIFNTWFIPVGGGTNKFESNIALSCYFKFNEGITGNSALDSQVLDYSGRINNGTIENFTTALRETGSAITEKLAEPEFKDPIIYSSHPDVVAKKLEYKTSGSLADLESTSMFNNYFPGWMQEEDEQNGSQMKHLSQVLGSYFDTLWHQINFVNRVHDQQYVSGSNKALPFAKKLLYDQGFVIPDLFVDATKIENLRQKDDNEVFEKEINEVRNTIYHNIYNNLDGIYKTKGTEKSFRNFFRSIGIGQDVVKLKMYADDSTFVLRDNYEYKSYERKFVDFNIAGHFDATIYQTSSANNSNIYIPGDSNFTGSFTVQSEVLLPRKQRKNEPNYNPYPYLSSSIFGYHSGQSYIHPSPDYGLQAYVVHSTLESNLSPDDEQRVKFVLTGSGVNLESDWYWGEYENNKWSLAIRVKDASYPNPNTTGSAANDYLIEFYGVEADGDTERNSFLLATSSVAHSYFSSDKIFYAGSHKTNFTGSTLQYTDVKLGYLRYWHSYLSDNAVKQHAFDSETFGTNEPFEQDLYDTYPVEIPREKTLGFHWAFNDLTSSNASGEFLVADLSSGSAANNYGSLSPTIEKYVAGQAVGFTASSSKVLDKNYLYSARKRLPDDLMSSDLTTIKSEETEQFFVDEDVSDNFYSFEKSMWGTISDEMMNMFSTALDMNNLIGQSNQKYHHKYGMAEFLRDRFFDDVENEPDIEKFTSFYKWIDDSISIALQQLTPASARFSEKINNIIESHVLERSKYVHQIPILTNFESTEGSVKGISEMKYNWKFGHAPTDIDNEANNCLWQRDRKKKDGFRETVRDSRNNHSIQSSGLIRREIDGTARISDTYAVRRFAKTYDVSIVSQNTIHGGTNFGRRKNLELFRESILPAGELGSASGVPQNVIVVGVGPGHGIVPEQVCNDDAPTKRRINVDANLGKYTGLEYGHELLGDFMLPMNVMTGTISTGFNSVVSSSYKSDVHFTNLHNDIVGNSNDIPMQGPFTENHVGGLQYRHIDMNQYDATTGRVNAEQDRPEGWGLVVGIHPVTAPDSDGAFGFVPADYEDPYPSATAKKATRYRDETAKRPVNLRNIKTVSGSWKVGNYKNELEIFQTSPTFQKTWAVEASNDPNIDILPPFTSTSLPLTTHYQTLVTRAPLAVGNVFGQMNNNRQVDSIGLEVQSLAINAATTSENYRMASSTAISGYSGFATGGKTISFWINLDNANLAARYIARGQNATSAAESFSIFFTYSGTQARLFYRVRGSGGTRVWRWDIDYNDYVGIWNHLAIAWDGNTTNAPKLYRNGSPTIGTVQSGPTGVTTIYVPERIYLFDDGTSNNSNYELQGSLQDFGVYSGELSTSSILQIYNSGVVRDIPYLSGNLYDYWKLGNANPDITFGDTVVNGTIFSSSYGSQNALTSSEGLAVVAGNNTLTRRTTPTNIDPALYNTITIPRTDLTGSQRNIITRFSAPGGPEIQSIGYLDAYTQTHTVHNAMPFRNLSVLGSGSGEEGTIRVEDHLGLRRGLRTLRGLHMGQFGIDSQYGEITSGDYPSSGSFNKQFGNVSNLYQWNSSTDITASLSESNLITGSNYDNAFINTPIPRSDLQYSWIHNATSGAAGTTYGAPVQRILGYAPRDGIISSSAGYVEAIVFPSASSIFGS